MTFDLRGHDLRNHRLRGRMVEVTYPDSSASVSRQDSSAHPESFDAALNG